MDQDSGASHPSRSIRVLIELCDEAIRQVTPISHRLPSGPLHDSAEVSRAGIPTVMMFVQSLGGLSHNAAEDTLPEHLELAVRAFEILARKTIAWVGSGEEEANRAGA